MIIAPVPGVVNALQVTIPGRLPSVPSVKALGNARDEKEKKKKKRRRKKRLYNSPLFAMRRMLNNTPADDKHESHIGDLADLFDDL